MSAPERVECAACPNLIDAGRGFWLPGVAAAFCPNCFERLQESHGRLCDGCVDTITQRLGSSYFAVSNRHPMRHSRVLDHCVDTLLLPFLEGFNLHVTRTYASCQGEPPTPGMKHPPQWITPPYVLVDRMMGGDLEAAWAWAQANRDRYHINAIEHRDALEQLHLEFARLPQAWAN